MMHILYDLHIQDVIIASGYHGIIEATAKSEQWPQSIFGTNYFA